nr:plasmid recombination protein [uncultured Albidiferax sp.]
MSGAAVLRIKKLKGSGIITVAARHNKREIPVEMGAMGSIDPTRSRLNYTLAGPATAGDVGQLAKDRMTAAGVVKLRKDAVMGLEIVFSLPSNTAIDDRAYFAACTAWAVGRMGGVILSADTHRDEAVPHCHVLLLPLIDGRMDGSNLLGGKQKLMALQKDFHAVVASKFGLSKAPARLAGIAKQAGAKAVLQKLREISDGALQSNAWSVIREAVERDPGPFLMALGVELATPKKKLRTFTQIMTGKGKGPAKEPNPIGFTLPKKEQTLCSVGFAPKPPVSLPAASQPRPALKLSRPTDDSHGLDLEQTDGSELETVRIRDCDLDPTLYDMDSGEYFKRPPAFTRN